MQKKTALMIIHGRFAWPGALADILPRLGYGIHICHVSDGCSLPKSLDGIDAVFLMGGPMGIYERHDIPWLQEEISWVKHHVDKGVPFFGICFGCQMLAHVYGGKVFRGDKGLSVGFKCLEATSDDGVFAGGELETFPVFSWQQDTYTVPQGAERLAQNHVYAEQAVKFSDTTYGVQFHPETTIQVMTHLYQRDLANVPDDQLPEHVTPMDKALATAENELPKCHKWLEGVLGRLLTTPK